MNRRSRFKLLFTALCVGWCFLFLRCETTEKSMVRAVYLARTETGTQVLLWYQASEASADASEASAAVQAAGTEGDTLEKALSAAEEALPQPVVMPMAAQPQMVMPDPLPDLTEEPEPLPDITEEPEPLPDITEDSEPLPDLMEEPESVEAEEEPVVDTELEPLMPEEPELLPEPEAEPEPEPEIESAAEPEAEPEIEELPPEPDLSDPNKMMSPDDIAALLASINSEAAAEPEVVADEVAADIPDEPVGQPEVLDTQIVSEPEQETATDASPMPDLSDPNKVMSPDEIAALFANLG